MRILKILILIAVIAGTITFICLSATIYRFYFPYVIFLLIALTLFSIPYLRIQKYWRNILIASFLLTICSLFFGINLLRFAEGGFDDGPFYPEKFSDNPKDFSTSESIKYRDGFIKVANRNLEPPIIYFEQHTGSVKWAVKLNVANEDSFANASVSKIENLKIGYGPFRDKLKFVATWTYGTERGYAYLWKWNSFQRYYLSW